MTGNILPALPGIPSPTPYDQTFIDGFELHLRGRRLSDKTLDCYLNAATLLARWATYTNRAGLDGLSRADLDGWLVWLRDDVRTRRGTPYSPGYINNLYRSVQQFFAWMCETENITNPMAKMKPPSTDLKMVPVLTDEEMTAILKSVEKGRYFDERRDHAILRLFLCSGMRLAELTSMEVEHLDLKNARAAVFGKGRKQRTVKFDYKTASALNQYLRIRTAHKLTTLPNLWLATNHRGPLTPNGVRQIITRRASMVGLKINPHMFRHNFSHRFLDAGGAEGDLMELNGWTSPQMLRRYGASARSARAQRAYDRLDVMGGI
ncbi:MAG TPA: tyrosine-type recombinase/integrase [Micromonosporaceae bacterium]|nr:tyrosine-type recombinase/integrase [Micromonosporaceae bacterium]